MAAGPASSQTHSQSRDHVSLADSWKCCHGNSSLLPPSSSSTRTTDADVAAVVGIDHFTNALYILWIALGIFDVTHTRSMVHGVKNI